MLCCLPLTNQAEAERPPLGRHLRDVPELLDVDGLALEDSGVLWVLERNTGRLVRVTATGERSVVNDALRDPRDLELDAGEEGDLWLTEGWGRGIVRLARSGEVRATFGAELLHRAHGLALDAKRVYVTDQGRHRVEVFDRAGRHLFGFGAHGSEAGEFIRPEDVAVDGEGRIYVADTGNSRVQVFDEGGEHLRAWGDWGPYPGLFHEPSGLCVREGRLYVSDRGNHRVQVFGPDGKLLDRFGLHAIRPREGAGFVHYPDSLALSPDGELAALAEPMVDRVQVFCRTGGSAEDEVRRQAQALAKPSAHYGWELEAAGPYLALAEPESHSVLFYENRAEVPRLIARVSGLGRKTGLLSGVAGLHFERGARDLWVSDPNLRRLSLFRLRGAESDEVGYDGRMARFVKSVDLARLFELELGAQVAAVPEVVALDRDEAGRLYLCDRRNGRVLVLSPELEVLEVFGEGSLTEPSGIRVDADGGRCTVVDAARGLLRFEGEERAPRLLAGVGPVGPLLAPHDLALAPNGTVFVTDSALHRVFVFDEEGQLLRSWGGAGLDRGEFYKPRGIDLDWRGNLVIVDHANHRLQSYTRAGEYVGVFGPRLYTHAARYPEFAGDKD